MLTFVDAKKILELERDVDHQSLKLAQDIVLLKFRHVDDFKIRPDIATAKQYTYSVVESVHDTEYPVFVCITKPHKIRTVDCVLGETVSPLSVDDMEFKAGHPCVIFFDTKEQKKVIQITATGRKRRVCRTNYDTYAPHIYNFDTVIAM